MRSALFMLIGLMVGGTLGVAVMCLLQISRLSDPPEDDA